jgi:predicted dehydrogenase
MISACRHTRVKLMVAYRLHFDPATLQAIDIARSGRLGKLVYFSSTFSHLVRDGDIRKRGDLGGGALFDMGIYCVNAARNLFGDEPQSVVAIQVRRTPGSEGVDETTTALLRFPGDRLAQLASSQEAADVDAYRVIGTEGSLRVEPGFSYSAELTHHLCIDDKQKTQKFSKSDQFAPELLHFAECIQDDMEPEPSGEEGLADVRILEAIVESARLGRAVELEPFTRTRRPGRDLEMRKPPVREPKTVHAPAHSR